MLRRWEFESVDMGVADCWGIRDEAEVQCRFRPVWWRW